MAASGGGQFPLCTYVRNFYLHLKPMVRIEINSAAMAIRRPSTKIAQRNLNCQKIWPPVGVAYRDNKDFISQLLWNQVRMQNTCNLEEVVTE